MALTERDKAYWRLHTGIFIAGGTGIFGRMISLSEVPLVWYRIFIAVITMAVILFINKKLTPPKRQHIGKIFACGFVLALHWVLFYASIKASNVSIAVVCIALNGFYTAILEPLINRHRVSFRELFLSLFTVAGILLIFGFDASYRLGIVLGSLSSLVYALFAILSKRVQASSGERSSIMLMYEMIGGELLLTCILAIYAFVTPSLQLLPQGMDWWLLPLFGSIFTIGPFLFQLQALRYISAFTVNLSFNLEPLYSIIFAAILFNEASELNMAFWIGLLLIIFSVALQTKKEGKLTN